MMMGKNKKSDVAEGTKTTATEITQEMLLNRGKENWRCVNESGISGYIGPNDDYNVYRRNIARQQQWQKENYWIYAIPFNVNYEADLISYLDSLDTVKPYITALIRKEMKEPYVNKPSRVRDYVKGNDTKRRSFSLKFSKEKDADVIAYLKTKESKRAYLIGLIEQDMIDTGYKIPEGLIKYNEENKVEAKSIIRKIYAAGYQCIEEKFAEGKNTVTFTELSEYIKEKVGEELSTNTYSSARYKYFTETGVLTTIPGASAYKISKRAFNKLKKPTIKV